MSDWIGIGFIVLLLLAALFGLYRLSKPYDVTPEEFEKRVQEGPGLISAGMIGLQKMLEPGAKKAIEVQEDLRQGRYNKKEGLDEPPEAGHDADTAPETQDQNER
jgi:hypothetical protein